MKGYIYIFNFGDYFARLTARKIKQQGGSPKIISFNTPFKHLKNPVGFVFSGSPDGSIRVPVGMLNKEVFASNYPVLGICLGAQLIARYFGGKYKNVKYRRENGIVEMKIVSKTKIFKGMSGKQKVFMMHEDSIVDLGDDFKIISSTDKCPIAGIKHKKWRWFGFQFHPELSPGGDKIFKNFVDLCYHDKSKRKPESKISIDVKMNRKIKQSLPEY